MDFDFTTENISPTATSILSIGGLAGLSMPSGTTAERPVAPIQGELRFNTTLTTAEYFNGSVWLPIGRVLQHASGNIPATTGTTQIATAVTATPTITDGFQIWTRSFTPISAASKLLIQFTTTVSTGTNNRPLITSCFAGSTNIGSVALQLVTSNLAQLLVYQCVYSPGSTAAITLSARTGPVGAATISVSQYNGTTNTLGGAAVSEYSIMELL